MKRYLIRFPLQVRGCRMLLITPYLLFLVVVCCQCLLIPDSKSAPKTTRISNRRLIQQRLPYLEKIIAGYMVHPAVDMAASTKYSIGGTILKSYCQRNKLTLSLATLTRGSPTCTTIGNYSCMIWLPKPKTGLSVARQLADDLSSVDKARAGRLQQEGNPVTPFDRQRILLLADDKKLPFGTMQIRRGGGYNDSHALEHLAQYVNISDMPRLRIGLSVPSLTTLPPKEREEWYERDFSALMKDLLHRVQRRTRELITTWLQADSTEEAMEYARSLPLLTTEEGIISLKDT